jgi:hypothetical protein
MKWWLPEILISYVGSFRLASSHQSVNLPGTSTLLPAGCKHHRAKLVDLKGGEPI